MNAYPKSNVLLYFSPLECWPTTINYRLSSVWRRLSFVNFTVVDQSIRRFLFFFFLYTFRYDYELGTATIKRPQRKKIQNQLVYELGGGEKCRLEWPSNEMLRKYVPVSSGRKAVKPVVHLKDLTCYRVFYRLRMERKKHPIFPPPLTRYQPQACRISTIQNLSSLSPQRITTIFIWRTRLTTTRKRVFFLFSRLHTDKRLSHVGFF